MTIIVYYDWVVYGITGQNAAAYYYISAYIIILDILVY